MQSVTRLLQSLHMMEGVQQQHEDDIDVTRLRMPSGCPHGFSLTTSLQQHLLLEENIENVEQAGSNKAADGGVTYGEYLRVALIRDTHMHFSLTNCSMLNSRARVKPAVRWLTNTCSSSPIRWH